jgi:hopanoid C-3 methylase
LQEFYKEFANLYSKAVPLYRYVPTVFRFGLRGILLRIKLFNRVLKKFKLMHLDY